MRKIEFIDVKISDLGEVVGGATPSTKNPANYDGNIAWITPKDLAGYNKVFISRGERNITNVGFKSCSTKMLPKNSVLFSSRAPIGYVAIAENELCTNQGFKSIIPNESVDYKFLYYLLKYNKDYLVSKGSGSTFKEISGSVMKNIVLSIPKELEIQEKIAKILYDIDRKIELNNKINNNLYEEAVALYKNKFCGIEQGDKTIGKYLTPKRGKNLLTRDAINGNIPVVAGGIEPSVYHNQFNTHSPVITISASGANAGYVNLWAIPVWASDCSYIDDTITQNVYFWYIVLKTRQDEIFDAQTGSAQPHIYPQHIIDMPMGELNIDEVFKYNISVEPLFKMIGENIKENKKLSELRDILLPKLMNGEIDLDNIEI